MLSNQALGWVVRNRNRRREAQQLHEAAERVLGGLMRRSGSVAQELIDAVGHLVDEEFTALCDVGRLQKGVLSIHVQDERYLPYLRIRWALELVEGLQKLCPEICVRRVCFVAGRGGRPLAASGASPL